MRQEAFVALESSDALSSHVHFAVAIIFWQNWSNNSDDVLSKIASPALTIDQQQWR